MNKKIMATAGFEEEVKAFDEGLCPFCHNIINEFRNELSEKEYLISGLCQSCQDEMFGVD